MASEIKIRTLIADDEGPARARLRQLLRAHTDFEITAECSNGREAVQIILEQKPDLVFLDVQMPMLSGLDVCESISSVPKPPLIIFVTAYDEYALKAFEFHAIDYLLKPFDRERFQKTLEHARDQILHARGLPPGQRLDAFLEDLRSGFMRNDRLVFKENGRVIFVRSETIDWIEADGNYVRLHAGTESHYIRGPWRGWKRSCRPPGSCALAVL